MPFLIIFVLIPLAEIMVFISVSDEIGLGTALLIALCTAILGGLIVKYQGIHTIIAAQQSMQQGQLPSKELFDGLCLVAAGATLITPGFITDAIGFALLVPTLRDMLRQKIMKNTHFTTMEFGAKREEYKAQDPNVIDVDYETLDDKDSS